MKGENLVLKAFITVLAFIFLDTVYRSFFEAFNIFNDNKDTLLYTQDSFLNDILILTIYRLFKEGSTLLVLMICVNLILYKSKLNMIFIFLIFSLSQGIQIALFDYDINWHAFLFSTSTLLVFYALFEKSFRSKNVKSLSNSL